MSDSIKVVCRLRPLNKIQIANNGEQCVTYSDKQINISVGGEQAKHSFAFDKIFGPNTQQVAIYKQVGIPVIKSVISGFNGTIFAYGQTGGGKTWTMEGPNHHDIQFKGLIPRTIEGLFQSIAQCDESLEFVIKSSYIEIYNQKLFDLLDPSKARLQIKQDRQKGVFIQNCTEISVSSAEQMLKTMDCGSQNRKVAFTGMNQRSSRSHSLFIIHLYQKNLKKDSTKQSKLYFVDLAGSQKVSKTGVMGQQLEQAKNINKSLSALGNVINALTSQKKEHVPYRDSKLTRILQQSLGGNSRTTLIINCSMCTYNDKETLSTLRFGYRAKSIKNKPKVNQEKSVKQLLVLLQTANKTINELKCQLKLPMQNLPPSDENQQDQKQNEINELKAQIECHKKQQAERTKQMESRIKQLILQLNKQKQDKNIHESKWSGVFTRLRQYIFKINKFVRRSYVDLEISLNNFILAGNENLISNGSRQTIQNTLKNIQQFEQFYKNQVHPIFQQIAGQQQDIQQQFKNTVHNILTPDRRRTKNALSQPVLYQNNEYRQRNQNQKTEYKQDSLNNMSCIVPSLNPSQQNNSDKVSQSECSQIQTMLESLETKQSHRMILQQMASSIKDLKKQNQELGKKIQVMLQQRDQFAIKLQEKYQDKILQLEERVHQYKNIMNQKDIELTKFFQDTQKMKKSIMEQKIVSQRLKKIIQTSSNMKSVHDLQQKMRSLANERQKIFNQLYLLRQQLDEAEISIKEKDQHIQSLKSVMKQLNEIKSHQSYTQQQITKSYNTQVFGTETPNVIQTVKGGGNKQTKKSALRKKTLGSMATPTNQKINKIQPRDSKDVKQYIPFFKTFFS